MTPDPLGTMQKPEIGQGVRGNRKSAAASIRIAETVFF
jgi:hypothetical protein